MTKNERDIFQRNLMVAIKLIAEAYTLNDPIKNLQRAQEMIRSSVQIADSPDVVVENG
jgi:hypothetical protein